MFDDIFGGMFDLNGDGHTDFAEEALGFAVMEDMMSEDESNDDFNIDSDDEWEGGSLEDTLQEVQRGAVMSNHDDFIDDYIEYSFFEDSMKKSSGGGKPPKRNHSGSGCCSCLIVIVLVILAVSVFGFCSKSNHKTYSSGSYRSSYNTSSRSLTSRSSYSNSSRSGSTSSSKPTTSLRSYSVTKTKPTGNSSDSYDAKSYTHPDDLYYDHPNDFWDYEDAEDYWEDHQDGRER